MASRASLIQSRSIYVGTSNSVAPSDGNLIVTGNVGIGTTSPSAKLHVSGGGQYISASASATAFLRLYSNAQTSSQFEIGQGFATTTDNIAYLWNAANASMAFGTNSTERMRITAAGNVGIGTTSPAYKLDVNGETRLGKLITTWSNSPITPSAVMYSETGYNTVIAGNGQFSTSYLALMTTGNMIYSGGNVGIGTTSPAYKLDVSGNINASGEVRGAQGKFDEIKNRITGNTIIDFDASNNVGINTTSPSSTLDVNTPSANNSFITVRQSFAGTSAAPLLSGILFRATSSNHAKGLIASENKQSNTWSSDMVFYTINATAGDVTDLAERMRLLGDATGSSPVLQLNGASTIRTSTGNLTLATNGGNGNIILSPNGTGNVGIGVTNPNEKLQVGGNINAYINGGIDAGLFASTSAGSTTIALRSNGVTHFNGGNVGIGTTSPSALFVVSNLGAAGIELQPEQTTDTNRILNYDRAVGAYMDLRIDANAHQFMISGTERMRIDSAGNVGIGTTSPDVYSFGGGKILTVSSTSTYSVLVLASGNANSGGISMGNQTIRRAAIDHLDGSHLVFYTNGTNSGTTVSERLRINSAGNVGINTTSPSYKLHTVGDAYFTSFTGVGTTPSSSWSFVVDALAGTDGAIKTTGSVLINTGALGVNITPSATAGRIDASNDIVAYSTSDQRLKENITPITNALDKVKALTGVEFDWKEETKDVHGYEGHDVGVIAQEVQAVLPEAVRTNDSGYLSVRYEKMIALLVEANKELAARVELLESKLKQ